MPRVDHGYALGIDYGTSNTVAVLRWPDGRVKPLLFDGSPLLPSAVFLDDAGDLLVGRDALHSGRSVCVEKPLTVDLAEGRALAELARQRGLTLFTAFPAAYRGAYFYADYVRGVTL